MSDEERERPGREISWAAYIRLLKVLTSQPDVKPTMILAAVMFIGALLWGLIDRLMR